MVPASAELLPEVENADSDHHGIEFGCTPDDDAIFGSTHRLPSGTQ